MIRLGSIELMDGLCLAPMAGFSDRAMRAVCHMHGAELAVTEMISARAVTYGDRKTFSLAAIREDEGAVALQIFGSDPDCMARAAEILSVGCGEGCVPPVAIDINMGCPVNKIFSNGEGSALMRDPALIGRIVRAVNEATPLPVSVKLRLGIDREHLNVVECAMAAEENGASLVCVHGRTRVEMYMGDADIEAIADVKKNLHIPVIANGDITDGASAVRALRRSGADGIAVGRGAVGNPFVFEEIRAALHGESYIPPSMNERVETALLQLRLAVEDKGERIAIPETRKQIASYLHSFRGAAAIRADINRALTYAEVERILRGALTVPCDDGEVDG